MSHRDFKLTRPKVLPLQGSAPVAPSSTPVLKADMDGSSLDSTSSYHRLPHPKSEQGPVGGAQVDGGCHGMLSLLLLHFSASVETQVPREPGTG